MKKEQVFLDVASDFVKFYAIMGHCLQNIMNEEVSGATSSGEGTVSKGSRGSFTPPQWKPCG